MPTFIYIFCFFSLLSCHHESANHSAVNNQRDTSELTSPIEVTNSTSDGNKNDLAEKYTQVISEYMKACYDQNKTSFDTLYIGIHADFPNIELPKKVENTILIPVIPEKDKETLSPNRKSIYLNIFGWVETETSEFILVTFHVEKKENNFSYVPQHDCKLNLTIDSKTNTMKLAEIKFEYPYPKK